MNVFNRIVMILAILVALALVIFLMIQPLTAAGFARTYVALFEESVFNDQFYFVYLVALGIVTFVLLLLLWGEMRRARQKTVRIRTQGGKVQLGIQSVAESLEYRIDELAGARKVQPKVRSRGRDVDVTIDLDTSPSVNVPVLTEQITDLVHDIVQGQLGVKIHGKVQVNVRHEPYPRGTMPSTGPLGGEAVTAPPWAAADAEAERSAPVQPVDTPSASPAAESDDESISA